MYLNFSIFTVFLKTRNVIFKMKISKVTDYAAFKCDFISMKFCIVVIDDDDTCSRRKCYVSVIMIYSSTE